MKRTNLFRVALCVASVSLAMVAPAAKAVVLDMEDIAAPGGRADADASTPMNGFLLEASAGWYYDSANPEIASVPYASNGTDYLLHNTTSSFSVFSDPVAPFSIQSFDATIYNLNLNGRADLNHEITVMGRTSTFALLSTVFTVDDLDPFQTFNFDSQWSSMRFVTFANAPDSGRGGGVMAYDNIVVSASGSGGGPSDPNPAPAPGTLYLVLVGAAALGFVRRRC